MRLTLVTGPLFRLVLAVVPAGQSVGVLSIGKLSAGQQEYYLGTVARGAEEYYTHSGEAPGVWLGGGAATLGLSGEVTDRDLASVLDAVDPVTGERLGRPPRTAGVVGFDLTFSAPKSVSLLFALGPDGLPEQVRQAHDAAVRDALGYLERTAAFGRRGHNGVDRVRGGGFVGAAFRHRTSRAGDPHLHTHVVVANRVQGADGRWTAVDGRALYAQARTAGFLYQASLRYHLRELGLEWTVGRNGLGEVRGVPKGVLREFSQRRRQVEQALHARGVSSMSAGGSRCSPRALRSGRGWRRSRWPCSGSSAPTLSAGMRRRGSSCWPTGSDARRNGGTTGHPMWRRRCWGGWSRRRG